MGAPLIEVDGLSKKFCRRLRRSLWYGLQDIGSELAGSRRSRVRLRKEEFWALRDVSFDLRQGELVGLIGANGAGKTTLLKVLSGLIKPDAGQVTIRGKIQGLIALGAGFNPILTGRENVYINGAVLGFSKREISRMLDEILAFSEMEEFIDMPVQSYSSGMHVRLGFAVAVNLKPNILIVDEVLAVGDASFRRKARNKMMELLHSGISVVFVSHNMALISSLTSRCIYLDRGRVKASGPSDEVTSLYLSDALVKNQGRLAAAGASALLMEAAYLTIPEVYVLEEVAVLDAEGAVCSEFRTFDDIRVRLTMDFRSEMRDVLFALTIREQVDDVVVSSSKLRLPHGRGRVIAECRITANRFREGNFHFGFYVSDMQGGSFYKSHDIGSFTVMADMKLIQHQDSTKGFMVMDAVWDVT